MGNAVTKIPTASPFPKARPGLTIGQAEEFTLISKLKPGGAQRMRELFKKGFDEERRKLTDRIGTVHDLRFVIFDNDSLAIFASTFDGSGIPTSMISEPEFPTRSICCSTNAGAIPESTALRSRTGSSRSKSRQLRQATTATSPISDNPVAAKTAGASRPRSTNPSAAVPIGPSASHPDAAMLRSGSL